MRTTQSEGRLLGRGYLTPQENITLGDRDNNLSGKGHLRWITLAFDVAGDVETSGPLAVSNVRRKVRAIVVYYNASSDAATRVFNLTLARPGGALPAGFAAGENDDIWDSASVTLTLSQEGTLYIGHRSFASFNDTGTLTYIDNTTAPHPLPFWTDEDDAMVLKLNITDGHENDRYAFYAQVEDWLEQ